MSDKSPPAGTREHVLADTIIRSLEPGEDWSWCYADQVAFVVDWIAGKTRIPPLPLLQ